MAKKKPAVESSIFESAIEKFKHHSLAVFNNIIHEKIKKLEQITVEIAFGLLFFTMGLFFLLAALVFFLHQYFLVSYFGGFLFVGMLTWGVASIFYFMIKHN